MTNIEIKSPKNFRASLVVKMEPVAGLLHYTTTAGAEAQPMPLGVFMAVSSQVPVDKVKASAPRLFFSVR